MKRFVTAVLALLMVVSFLSGCETQQQEDGFRLWFVEAEGDGSRELATELYSGEESVPALMEALLAGPGGMSGLTSPIPADTVLQEWSQSGTVVHVDLSRPYGSLEGVDLTLADYCITLTLTQLDGVEGVRITVNGAELPHRSRVIFQQGDVVISGAEEEPVELIAALCFRRIGGNELGVEQRMFRLTESQSATLAVLQALVTGPEEGGLQTLLPEGVEIYSARVETGICYADFSYRLLENVPATEEEQRLVIRSVVESLCSLGYVQAVQILVEGEPLQYYGQIDVSQPIN